MNGSSVLLADRRPLFREVVGGALESVAGCHVSGCSGALDETLRLVASLRPEVALISADLDDVTGLELCAELRAHDPTLKCLLVGLGDAPDLFVAALEAGAVGYVSQSGGLADLFGAVRGALRGEACIPRQMLGGVLAELVRRRRVDDAVHERFEQLTCREREVLVLLVEGLSHEDIAARLVVAQPTARNHIQAVLRKLGVHSRMEARALAVEHELLDGAVRR